MSGSSLGLVAICERGIKDMTEKKGTGQSREDGLGRHDSQDQICSNIHITLSCAVHDHKSGLTT
jgi:hypothetical protein